MLKKLIVQDLKNTKATMTLICLANIVIGILNGLVTNDEGLLALTHLMLNAATSMIATIYMLKYYSKSLYSSQGYLSFTLPTTKTNVVVSKMIITGIWVLIFLLSVLISFMISYPEVYFDSNPGHSRAITELVMSFYNYFAFTIYIISQLMALFFCISLGQICKKHPKICATLCYMVIGFASLYIFFYNFSHNYIWRGANDGYWKWEDVFCLPTVLCAIALTAFSCAASIYITNKKLNLE